MLRQAELWNIRPQESNPCYNMRRYRTPPRERFPSLDGLKRLGVVLDVRRTPRPRPRSGCCCTLAPGCPRSPASGGTGDRERAPSSRIVIEARASHVSTALIALNLNDALNICDKLNRRLGYDRDAWTALAAASMQAEDDDPVGGVWH